MSTQTADRNLLFGILALQMDFIGREALIHAMNAWVLDKRKPLGQILHEHNALSNERLAQAFIMAAKCFEARFTPQLEPWAKSQLSLSRRSTITCQPFHPGNLLRALKNKPILMFGSMWVYKEFHRPTSECGGKTAASSSRLRTQAAERRQVTVLVCGCYLFE